MGYLTVRSNLIAYILQIDLWNISPSSHAIHSFLSRLIDDSGTRVLRSNLLTLVAGT